MLCDFFLGGADWYCTLKANHHGLHTCKTEYSDRTNIGIEGSTCWAQFDPSEQFYGGVMIYVWTTRDMERRLRTYLQDTMHYELISRVPSGVDVGRVRDRLNSRKRLYLA